MSQLQFALLGSPQIRLGGHLLTFSTRKETALLVYLAVEGGIHSRKHLIDLLWPDSDAVHGRAAFRITLSRLREQLREDEGQVKHLLSEGKDVSLDKSSGVTLDLDVVHDAWTEAKKLALTSNMVPPETRQRALTRLEQASLLWRGNFLDGFSLRDASPFDDWMRSQHQLWQLRLRTIMHQFAQLQEETGELSAAQQTIARWLATDPLDEEAYQRLMRVQVAQGDRIAALQTYETCSTLLKSELHAEPGLHMIEMAHRLRATIPTRKRSSSTPYPPATLLEGPLVGRDLEFGKLIECHQRASQGQPQLVLLEGEAGIGKTRLLADFLEWTRLQGAEVLQGRAFEMGGHMPYQPLIDAIRPRLERENAPDDLLDDAWLGELSRLLPEMRDRYPDLPAPQGDLAMAQTQLFEAIAQLVQALTHHSSLLLVVDDLHWVDSATLDVLLYLARRCAERGSAVLLLVSWRPEEVETRATVEKWLLAMQRHLPLTHLTLPRLSADATQQLLSTLLISNVEEHSQASTLGQVSRWLYKHTRGQPFYLKETLKLLLERGMLLLQYDEVGNWTLLPAEHATTILADLQTVVPAGVQALLRAQLSTLSLAARTLLQTGAILGQRFAFESLCQIAQLAEPEGLQALDEVLARRLLQASQPENSSQAATYSFTHDLIRESVYEQAGQARQRSIHRRALKILQGADVPAAELARHALAAQLVEEGVRWSVQAGNEVIEVFAIQDAITWYQRARQIITDPSGKIATTTTFPFSTISHLFLQLGHAYELKQQWEAAQQVYETLQAYAEQQQDARLRCIILNRLVHVLALDDTQLARVRTLLHQAHQAAKQCGDEALLKETHWNEFHQGGAAWDQTALAAWGPQRARRIQEMRNWLVMAQPLTDFAYDNPQMTHWEKAQASVEQAIAWYQQQGNTEMEAYGWMLLSASQLQQDRLPEVMVSARMAMKLIEQSDSMTGKIIIRGSSAYWIALQGGYEEAWVLLQDTIPQARRVGFIPLLEEDLAILGDIYLLFGHDEQARQAYQEGLAMSERLQIRGDIELLASRLCLLHGQRGEWTQALVYAEQAQAAREDYALPLFLVTSMYETETWLRAGKQDEAEREIARLERRLGTNRRYRISLAQSRAVLARYAGKPGEAIEHLYEAAALAQEPGLPREQWQVQAALADLFCQQGDEGRARSAITQAAAIIHELAERITDETLRSNFLTSQPVRQVLEQVRQKA